MHSKEQILKNTYLFANKEVPCALISAIIEHFSNFDPAATKDGHVGLMGITYDQAIANGHMHIRMFDPNTNITVGVNELQKLVKTARSRYPTAKLDDWYMLAISAFLNGGKITSVSEISRKIWENCRETVMKKS